MSKVKLFSFRRCPYAIRARLALQQSAIPFTIEEIDLKAKPKHFLELSPKATVPVLVVDNETIIEESIQIVEWAENQSSSSWPIDLLEKTNLIEKLHDTFIPALNRHKYPNRFESVDQTQNEQNLNTFISSFDQQIVQSESNQLISKTELLILPFVRQLEQATPGWLDDRNYTQASKWLTKQLSTDDFKTIMAK